MVAWAAAAAGRSRAAPVSLVDGVEPGEEAGPPADHRLGIEPLDLAVEDLVLIDDRGDQAARVQLLHPVDQLGVEVEEQQEALQRIVGQLLGAQRELVHDRVVLGEEADQQLAGEVALVLEVIEEAALGDPGGLDQLVDRGAGEPLVDDRVVGEVEDAFARALTLGEAGGLYRRYSFRWPRLLVHAGEIPETRGLPSTNGQSTKPTAFLL